MDKETSLSIAHLNKLFMDIKQNVPSIGSSQHINEIYEQKIYNILPLFCKMFTDNGLVSAQLDIFEKFCDQTSFTQMVSRLMVTEIRRCASNKSTENASIAIVEFLEISPTVNISPDNKKGWILLSTLNILVSFNSVHLISIMTSNSLASTLVKCLYLFFDLPPCVDTRCEESSDFLSNTERRQLLQKVFSQLLTRLCSSPSSLNDLTRKDDLLLLFNAITSWCPEYNSIWRETASDVILTMAKFGNVNVEYLHSKNCVNLFIENIQRIVELGTTNNKDIILMFKTFVYFLSEYANNATNSMVNVLLDDFSTSFGYQFFVDFGIKLEQLNEFDLLDELLDLIRQFTKIGSSILKPRPLSVNQLFIIDNFSIPKPSKNSLKNLKAFNILVSLWNKSKTEFLQNLILESILSLYKEDKANYFVLEVQNTLSTFGERLEEKSDQTQLKYYSLLEHIVLELNYVPCKELITTGIILKRRYSDKSTELCLVSLIKVLKHNAVFRDVYREIGLLDIICSLYCSNIQMLVNDSNDCNETMLNHLVELLINILNGPNNNNCCIFHDCGASKETFTLITHRRISPIFKTIRKRVFLIVQQLVLSSYGEENLSQLLALLHNDQNVSNNDQESLSLKLSILKSLLVVLSENHRIRALFRKVGGFVSVISVIVYMENCLSGASLDVDNKRIWNLLRCVFATITTAMRFEPANSKYFSQEICSPSFTDSLRLLGCFENNPFSFKSWPSIEEYDDTYERLFTFQINDLPPKDKLTKVESSCILMRLIYDMAIDICDKSKNIPPEAYPSNEVTPMGTPIIVYPCIVISMLHLTQYIASEKLCHYLVEKIRLLLSLERNLQVMCDMNFATELLNSSYVEIFIDENHPLHSPIQFIFERLAAQHIQAKDLRLFLRLSDPLNCIPLDEIKPKVHQMDRCISLSRIKSIISMTTPKDTSNNVLLHPPFIEFDMSQEGFSCIFIPSIAPLSTFGTSNGPTNLLTGAIVGNSDLPVSVSGGIGTGERTFPSQSGLSFTTWIYVHRSTSYDDHTISILTLYRANQANQEYTCFQVYISPKEKSLTISTQELPIFHNKSSKVSLDSDHNARILVPELFEESWNHIVVILNRTLLKNSTINVYINGKLKLSQKLLYISSIVGGNFGISNASPLYINGFIGTPPQYRRHSNLIWKQGPCHLIEEPLQSNFVSYIYLLGPNYIGSFQAINFIPSHLQSQQQQISEDRLIFGLNSRAISMMTLSKMRRVYSKFDCKQISKIIGISTHENATPIYVLHNSAGHLIGPSRPLGGILIGNIGARCFVPKQISLTFSDIGGSFLLLGLVANSKNMETLYASVKSLVCILRTNREIQLEMEHINGYQTLAVLLKRKRTFLNSHILHLLFDLINNLNSKLLYYMSKTIYINLGLNFGQPSNYRAFKELLVDSIDVWMHDNFLKTLLDHFNEIIYESTRSSFENKGIMLNIMHLREMNLLSKLINIFEDKTIDEGTLRLIFVLCFKLLNQTTRQKDLLYFGQYIVSLIPVDVNEKSNESNEEYSISLRNSLLKVILQLMTRNTPSLNNTMQEELVQVLGFDWFLLFLKDSLNKETITIGCVNLMLILSNANLYQKFRDGLQTGNWLKEAEAFIANRTGIQLLGFNISTSASETINNLGHASCIQKDLLALPGFVHLNLLLGNHVYEPKVYLIIFQTMLGFYRNLTPQILDQIESFEELSVDNLLKNLCLEKQMKNFKQIEIICKDLILSVISMVHSILWFSDKENQKYNEYPKILIHFIKYLYNNNRDFRYFCQANFEFLNMLCKSLINNINETESEFTDHPSKKIILDFILTILINLINMNQNSFSGINSASSSFFSNQKPITIFENILNSLSTSKKAQTEIITLLMDCIITSQEFNQSTGSQVLNDPTNVILNFSHSYANIVLLMSCVVDKLWQNCYIDDRKKILDCLIKILKINNSESKPFQPNFKSLKNLTFQLSEINLLNKSTNRCVLYLISRTIESISDRIFIFEILQLIYSNRQVIITQKANNDAEFFICLTHCLLQLIDEESISLSASKGRTTWYVVETAKNSVDTDEGALLIASVAKKIWDEIYLSKKQLLEDTLKINLSQTNSAFGVTSVAPDISQLRDILYDSTLKFWFNYIDNENQRLRRKPSSLSFDLPLPNSNIITEKLTNINKFNNLVTKSAGGFVSKIVGGTSGVVGTAISSAVGNARKEMFRTSSETTSYSTAPWTLMSMKDASDWTSIHISVIKDFISFQLKQKRILDHHLNRYILTEWLNYEYEFLTREKAIWGPSFGSKRLDKWMLDMTEGPNRMRKKMIRNDQFYTNYPYRPELDVGNGKMAKLKSAVSLDSKDYYKRVSSEKYFLLDKQDDNNSFEFEINELSAQIRESDIPSDFYDKSNTNNNNQECNRARSARVFRSKSSSDYDDNEPEVNDPTDSFDISEYVDINSEIEKHGSSKKDYDDNEMQTILRLLEDGEKISHMFRAARIQGLDSHEGLLLFGKEHFYLLDGFTLLKTREIRDIDSLPLNMHDPIIPNTQNTVPCNNAPKLATKKLCSKFAYEDIKEVHKRRYLLQPIALEIFSMDGRNSLVVFPRNMRNKVNSRFMSVAMHITDSAHDSLMGQKRNANVETGGLLSNLIGETSVTQRWVRGEISNFQYLMNLNTLAGRSYNDLMQYPVFPWILADYTSPELDLSNPESFRDLSRPMGAQTPERLEQFKKRFNDFEADSNIKGGGDDLIQGPYHYGTFYSSAMIVASYLVRMEPFTQHFLRLQGGHFDLADRMFHSIGDAWNSAARHNMADLKELIPEFFYLPEFLVNSNHFDFGFKQNGTKLDDVILPPWAKNDPREFIRFHRSALESDYVSAHLHEWIDLIFGFKQNGQAAVEAVNVFHHLFYEGNADIYNIDDPLKKNATIGFINNFGQIPKQLFKKPHPVKKVFISSNGPFMSSLSPILPSVNPVTGSANTSKIFIHNVDYLKPSMQPIKELRGAVGQIIQQDKTLLAVEQNKVLIPPQFNRYVAWGFADHSLRIGPYESDRALYIWESELFPPNGEILCATVPNPRMIITAGTNSVISVWRVKSKSLNLTLVQKLYGHTEAITCLSSSSSYGIVVSGSRDKTCILWDLNRLVFVRQLGAGCSLIHTSPIAAIAINDLTGDIATCCSTMLYLWSINGILIANINTLNVPSAVSQNHSQNSSQILCLAFSTFNEWDPNNVILSGSSDGVVKIWSVKFVQEQDNDSSSSTDSSYSEDIKNSISLNPSKDEIVRRLSTVSIQNENQNDSTDDSLTPVDHANDTEWDLLSYEHNQENYSLTHSTSFGNSTLSQLNKPTISVLTNIHGVNSSKSSSLTVPKIRNSKSDSSLIESFIVVNDQQKKEDMDVILKVGYKWTTKLVFRSKLTMHTAFECKENKEPAGITCISISKDHRNVFVGDARGRIYSWSVNETRSISDHWVKDDTILNCTSCSAKFSLTERKHHCRNCGCVFCSKCSRFESPILRLKLPKPVRVCQNCYNQLQHQPKNDSSTNLSSS